MKKIMFNDKYGLTQAVLEGRKTQIRGIITCPQTFKGRYVAGLHVYKRQSDGFISEICMYDEDERDFEGGQIVPKYRIGEIVAIAQSYMDCGNIPDCDFDEDGYPIMPRRSGIFNKMLVKPELMPHQIKITNVRVERLQDISDEDCLAEGIVVNEPKINGGVKSYYPSQYHKEYADIVGWGRVYDTPKKAYAELIDKAGNKGDWESNPYVFVYEFELLTCKN